VSEDAALAVREARATTECYAYRTPMKFGGRVVRDVVVLNCEVRLEDASGRSAWGQGSMTVGSAWAWPSKVLSSDETTAAMVALGERVAEKANQEKFVGHPLEISLFVRSQLVGWANDLQQERGLAEAMPELAALVAYSPFDAALLDAYGKLRRRSTFALVADAAPAEWLASHLDASFAGESPSRYVLDRPRESLPLYHLVGALDPLVPSDVATQPDDDLPVTLGQWIERDGLTHLKIKLAGDDLAWDVERTIAVDRVADESAADRREALRYSLDFNERCENVDYVLAFLRQLQERSPAAFARTQYLEQPTHRDLKRFGASMLAAAAIKPVVIDESLVDYESLLLAREQGYSGVALKACKGLAESILLAATAQKYGMFLCVQDLTCVGRSLLQSIALAAHLPTVAAIEGNGRQYCPQGNDAWRSVFPDLMQPVAGRVASGKLDRPGIGYGDLPSSSA
jgi:L-alanine-DL-glutamate epimerase-like enolase superfamily enzyme